MEEIAVMPINPKKHHSEERGFNLIEVLVAMAMLGVVLISIMSLFSWGRRHVYAGRQMTKAVALSTRALEDLNPLTKKEIYSGLFAITDAAVGSDVIIEGVTYANAKIRSTDPNLIASPPTDIQSQTTGGPDILGKWTTQLGKDLQAGSVTLVMQPRLDPAHPSPNEQFGNSQILRLRLIVRWSETGRRRNLVLDSVKPF